MEKEEGEVPGIGERKLKMCMRQPSSSLFMRQDKEEEEDFDELVLFGTLRFHFGSSPTSPIASLSLSGLLRKKREICLEH